MKVMMMMAMMLVRMMIRMAMMTMMTVLTLTMTITYPRSPERSPATPSPPRRGFAPATRRKVAQRPQSNSSTRRPAATTRGTFAFARSCARSIEEAAEVAMEGEDAGTVKPWRCLSSRSIFSIWLSNGSSKS